MSKTLGITLKGSSAAVFAGLVILMAGTACNRTEDPVSGEERRTVTFVLGDAAPTRASVTPYEDAVSSLDVLCFRMGDGALEGANRTVAQQGQALSGITCDVREGGSYDWFVVANAPAGALSYRTESAFLAGVTELTHGTSTSLVMMGSGTLTDAPQAAAVPVSLDRYICKVTVEEVVVEWSDAFTSYASVQLGRIALVNVVGTTPWSAVPAAGSLWYNRTAIDYEAPAYVQDMTVRQYGIALQEGVAVSTASPLYCMPNPVHNEVNSKNASAWSPRNTRVAVELVLDGFPTWYPVDLPAMSCNRHYVINRLIIKGPGSQGPDWPVERDDMQFTISVQPWVDGDVVPLYE